jgi:CDP-diacylglycerol--glycerol-3-phosphate 3-phosphatidyltransferase
MIRNAHILINVLTGSRIPLAVGAAACLLPFGGEAWSVGGTIACVALLEVSDMLDGWLARRLGAVSDFGKLFDPFADAVSRFIVFWALAQAGSCWATVPVVMAVRDLATAYTRLQVSRQGGDVSARWSGKVKAIVQGACALALAAGPLYWGELKGAVVAAASVAVLAITVASLIDYVVHARSGSR